MRSKNRVFYFVLCKKQSEYQRQRVTTTHRTKTTKLTHTHAETRDKREREKKWKKTHCFFLDTMLTKSALYRAAQNEQFSFLF